MTRRVRQPQGLRLDRMLVEAECVRRGNQWISSGMSDQDLVLRGGHGAGLIEEPLLALLQSELPLDTVVVAGQNREASGPVATPRSPTEPAPCRI